jgi:hypothetical protein
MVRVLLIALFSGCIASSVAAQGVQGVWVSASQWPNARTHAEFAKDAVRLYGAENGTDEQKALAIYYYSLRVMGHGGDFRQGPYGQEQPVWDNWMIFHSYSKGLCEWWAWFLVDAWKAYNNNWSFDPAVGVARKVSVNAPGEVPAVAGAGTHAQAALRYRDADGVSRWHLFDGNLGFYAHAHGVRRIATPEEIHAGYPALLTAPYAAPEPFFLGATVQGDATSDPAFRKFLGNTYPFFYSGSRRLTKYSTRFDLRAGESIRRQWYDDGKAVVAARDKDKGLTVAVDGYSKYAYSSGLPKDPYNFDAIRPYIKNYPGLGLAKPFGNAYSVYTPELSGDKFKEGARSFAGLASGTGGVKLGTAAAGVEGNVVYQVRSIYPFAESFITGSYYLRSSGRVGIDFSLDSGATWIAVMDATTVQPTVVPFSIDIGKARWNAGLPSPYNMPDRDSQFSDASDPRFSAVKFFGFQYLVRIRIRADADLGDAGLASLTLKNTHQLNIGMLPTLLPGLNTITVQGELTPGSILEVVYAWLEEGLEKTHREVISSLPHVYNIDVAELDPLKVRCLWHTITSSTAPTGLPFVEVAEPGGASAVSGVPLSIRWASSGAHTFSVSASSDDGTTWRPVQECAGIGATECRWANPSPASVNTRVRVDAHGTEGGVIASDVSARFAITPAATGAPEVVLYAARATVAAGWTVTPDSSAATGARLQNANAGAAKLTIPPAAPAHYFEMTFNAQAGLGYRLWMRGIAASNHYANDSAYVQFDGSVDQSGVPIYRIGTTNATPYTVEDCSGCGVSGWGWQDNGYGSGVLGPLVYFATSGPQRVRVQVREDGLSIDQIVLSSQKYLRLPPGALKNDGAILAEVGTSPSATPETNPANDVVLYVNDASVAAGWTATPDATAAGGARLQNPNTGAAKLTTALASPAHYFEIPFTAVAGIGYRLWIRGTATSNHYANDSAFVQFDKSVDQAGVPIYRIGTTAATVYTLEDCSGCGMSGWGWQDNGYGAGVLGPLVYFGTSGPQRLRVQVREDGLGIDQIVLSPQIYLRLAPGAPKSDRTILPR